MYFYSCHPSTVYCVLLADQNPGWWISIRSYILGPHARYWLASGNRWREFPVQWNLEKRTGDYHNSFVIDCFVFLCLLRHTAFVSLCLVWSLTHLPIFLFFCLSRLAEPSDLAIWRLQFISCMLCTPLRSTGNKVFPSDFDRRLYYDTYQNVISSSLCSISILFSLFLVPLCRIVSSYIIFSLSGLPFFNQSVFISFHFYFLSDISSFYFVQPCFPLICFSLHSHVRNIPSYDILSFLLAYNSF